jgi:hypothetical protein
MDLALLPALDNLPPLPLANWSLSSTLNLKEAAERMSEHTTARNKINFIIY